MEFIMGNKGNWVPIVGEFTIIDLTENENDN